LDISLQYFQIRITIYRPTMKVNAALLGIAATIIANFSLTSGHVIASSDLASPANHGALGARGSKGGSSKGGGSSSSSSSSGKKSSKLKKGSSSDDADAELKEWGMERSIEEESEDLPLPYHWNNEVNDVAQKFDQNGDWEVNIVHPDKDHAEEYGTSDIYHYQTNVAAGAFHTSAVYTTELVNGDPRTLPVNRRALTYNAWIEAGGDPAALLMFSDENIKNPDTRAAFEEVFRRKDGDASRTEDQWLHLDRSDPVWKYWDDGKNPFPDGYETMTIDYTDMQSMISYVVLYVDPAGGYNAMHMMEHVPGLERRLQARAEYFERRNATDPGLM
jgi:hypothetical protein